MAAPPKLSSSSIVFKAAVPTWSLGAARFPLTAEEDQYRPPLDLKLETRPRHATTMAEWHRDAKREAWCRGLFYGTEHYQPIVEAADELLRLHEDDPNAWPRDEVWDVWAETHGHIYACGPANITNPIYMVRICL